MFPNVLFLDIPTGRVTIGATVCSTVTGLQGMVTEICQIFHEPGVNHRLEIAGRKSEPAANFELVAPVPADVQALLDQAQRPVTSGAFEVRVCQEGDRVYFADTAEQVMQLLSIKIGIHPDFLAEETDRLKRAAAVGRCQELRLRGCFGVVGPLAYVSSGQPRPMPRYAVGQTVYLFNGYAPYMISEVCLVQGDLAHQLPAGRWHYYRAGDVERLHRYPEDVVSDEPITGPNIPVIAPPLPLRPERQKTPA